MAKRLGSGCRGRYVLSFAVKLEDFHDVVDPAELVVQVMSEVATASIATHQNDSLLEGQHMPWSDGLPDLTTRHSSWSRDLASYLDSGAAGPCVGSRVCSLLHSCHENVFGIGIFEDRGDFLAGIG